MQAEQQSGAFPKRIMDLLQDIATPDGGPNRGPWEDGNGRRLDADARKAVEWINARAALSHPSTPQWLPIESYALQLLVAAGHITQQKADEAMHLARATLFPPPPEQGDKG